MADDANRTVTLKNPLQAAMFEVGDEIILRARPPRWYVRLWRWIRRGFRKQLPPGMLTVMAVDYEKGVIAVADRSN